MWLAEVLETHARRTPNAPALIDARRALTWSDLRQRARAAAALLREQAGPGERILILSANRAEVLETYLGCAYSGVIAAPLNPGLADPELGFAISQLQPALAVADDAGRARLHAQWPQLPSIAVELVAESRTAGLPPRLPSVQAPFAILQTSATTGRPKGVVVDQRSLQLNALSWLADVRPHPATRFLNAGPLFHGSMVIALDYLAAGCAVHILESFTPQSCLRAIERWQIQDAFLVPTMVRILLETRQLAVTDVSSLQLLLHGAAPMPADLAEQARRKLGTDLQTIYGITEGGGPVLTLRQADAAGNPAIAGATCVGLPMTGTAARVRDEHGRDLPPGEVGLLHLAGDGLMRGYWTGAGVDQTPVADGWLNTGDLGYRDKAGFFWVVDRRNDLILRGGQNVYPAEIERILRDHPSVADAAVVPALSRTWGQTPVAFIQPTAGKDGSIDGAKLIAHCAENLASYKRPSQIIPIAEIPRNPSGKILRRQLRACAEQAAAAAPSEDTA